MAKVSKYYSCRVYSAFHQQLPKGGLPTTPKVPLGHPYLAGLGLPGSVYHPVPLFLSKGRSAWGWWNENTISTYKHNIYSMYSKFLHGTKGCGLFSWKPIVFSMNGTELTWINKIRTSKGNYFIVEHFGLLFVEPSNLWRYFVHHTHSRRHIFGHQLAHNMSTQETTTW